MNRAIKHLGVAMLCAAAITGSALLHASPAETGQASNLLAKTVDWLDPTSWFGKPTGLKETETSAPTATLDTTATDVVASSPAVQTLGMKIRTSKGNMVVELFPQEAPKTVANFRSLVQRGFYNSGSMVFHRVVPDFVVQTGDPTGTGYGGSGQTIPLEVKNNLIHNGKGILAMARSTEPDSASSQFYITKKALPSLDGKYAVFGRVIQGLDVIDRIQKGDLLFGIDEVDIAGLQPEAAAAPRNTVGYQLKSLFTPKPKTKK